MSQGEKFKDILEKRHISRMAAAKKLGIDRRAVYQMFNTKAFHENTLDKIEKFLGITREEILSPRVEDKNIASEENYTQNVPQIAEASMIEMEIENAVLRVRLEAAERALEEKDKHMEQIVHEKDMRISDLSAMLKKEDKKRDPHMENPGRTKPARPEKQMARE